MDKQLRSDTFEKFMREAYNIDTSFVNVPKLSDEDIIQIKSDLKIRSQARTKRRRVPIAIVEVVVTTTDRKLKKHLFLYQQICHELRSVFI